MKKAFFLITVLFTFISSTKAQMENDTIKLKACQIKETRMYKVPYLANDISKAQIQNTPTRDIGDFLRTIPNVSGVRRAGASIDPVVRGFKFSDLNVILDNGIKVENGCPNRMDPTTSHVEVEDIEKIDVIKGPYIMKYGPALGGVVNLLTEKPHPYDTFQIHANALYGFETNWNGQKEHISVNGGNKSVYFLISGGYRNYGNYESGNLEGHDTTINSSFRKFNYGAKLGLTLKKNHDILLSYYEISGRDIMYPSLNMDDSIDNTSILSLDYCWKEISKTIQYFDVKVYQSHLHHVMDNSHRSNWATKKMIADVTAVSTGAKTETMLKINKNKILIGFDFDNINKDGERTNQSTMGGNVVTKKSSLWRDAVIQNAGLYAEYTTFFSMYEISASIRGDFNKATSNDTLKVSSEGINYFTDNNSQFANLSASLGLTRRINEWFTISFSVGRGTRSPNMLERYIKLLAVGYDNYDYLGNPQLKPEINNEADLTFKFNKESFGGLYINGFYSYVQKYIFSERIPDGIIMPQTMGVLGIKQFVNVDHVTFKGFEIGYNSPEKFKLGGSIIAAYTYALIPSDTKYILSGAQVIGTETIKNDALTEIPPFETTVSVYCKFLKGSFIPKLSCRIVADQRHTSKAYYEPYTPGFATLNFSAKYKMNKYVSVYTGITNIFDRGYYEHLNRNVVGTSARLYEPGRVFYININVAI
jgi:iron complex outermembrane recepter protein